METLTAQTTTIASYPPAPGDCLVCRSGSKSHTGAIVCRKYQSDLRPWLAFPRV